MKRGLFMLLAAALFIVLFAAPAMPVQAADSAYCVTTPGSGPVGTVFEIDCHGFSPNTWLYPYVVEPSGATGSGECYNVLSAKTDSTGSAVFQFDSWPRFGEFQTCGGFLLAPQIGGAGFPRSLGTWTVVVEQLGLAGSKVHSVANKFNVTGIPSSVNGAALLTSDQSTVYKREWFNLMGSGFLPNEWVTVWFDFPNGDCASSTQHYGPITFDIKIIKEEIRNVHVPGGFSTGGGWMLKADGGGDIALMLSPEDATCEGTYHWVAKGSTSGNSAETWVTVTAHAPSLGASLVASPSTVFGLRETATFMGSGYTPGEAVTCWNTSPQGQAFVVSLLSGTVTIGKVIENPGTIVAGPGGTFSFDITTGSDLIFAVNFKNTHVHFDEAANEGALGQWAMSCRGNTSGVVGVADYTVTGMPVEP
ncbi:MAG: hypothetical protein WCF84_17020 [Anaerolineae bacterium]